MSKVPKIPARHYVIGILIAIIFLTIPDLIHTASLDEPFWSTMTISPLLTTVVCLLVAALALKYTPKVIEKISHLIGMPCRVYYRLYFRVEIKKGADYNFLKLFFLHFIISMILIFCLAIAISTLLIPFMNFNFKIN